MPRLTRGRIKKITLFLYGVAAFLIAFICTCSIGGIICAAGGFSWGTTSCGVVASLTVPLAVLFGCAAFESVSYED